MAATEAAVPPTSTPAATPAAGEKDGITPTTVLSAQAPRVQHASLYVGDLDPAVREEQLVELFRGVGPVLGVRICRDIITQRSLGYAYVNYQQPEDAEKALQTLNYTMVGTKAIRLMFQQRDPTLRYSGMGNIFVKNIDATLDNKGLHELFRNFGSILSCKVVTDETGKSRRYGFVHFKEDHAAIKAIEEMNGKKDEANGVPDALYVAHFLRRNARVAALLANFTNVYIKHVLPEADKDVIEKFFAKFGGITSSAAKKDPRGRIFAFCNFGSHDHAVKCIEEMHDKVVEGLTAPGEKLFVQRAQSRSERLFELRHKHMQRQSLGNNLYVRNFGPDFGDDDLKELFREFGEISSARVMKDDNGHARGFGFVCFVTAEQANHALREMNGRMLRGKPLVVNVAQRRDQRYSMLQIQFQQRLHAMMQRMPLLPFVTGGLPQPQPRAPMLRALKAKQPQPQNRQYVQRPAKAHKEGEPEEKPAAVPSEVPPPTQHYTVPRTPPQQPVPSPAQPPQTPPLPPLTVEQLLAMPVDEQKTALGERLYVKVSEITPQHAPKITGMFLEMSAADALHLLDQPARLAEKVEEALCVLKAHEVKKQKP